MKNLINSAVHRQITDTTGAMGGKGGGGGGGSEAPDTIATNEVIKVLHALCEGEASLYTGDGQSIFINNTPLQNPDGSFNFGNPIWEFRNGSLSQTLMDNPAFPGASQVFGIGDEVLFSAPAIYSVTSGDVDYALVTIQLPDGLISTDSKGNIGGNTVTLSFDVKPHSSGTWTTVSSVPITGTASTEVRQQYQVNNPSPGNLWDIRVSRLTADNSTAVNHNETYLFSVEEVQKIQLTYDGIVLLGLVLNAAVIGGQNASIPSVSVLLQPGPISIPSNYDPNARTYTGTWDGTFTTGVTDNPAWIVYAMLTNPRYGMYLYGIRSADIDPFSFYNAAVFNDQLVPDGLGGSGTEPRFTFNGVLQNRQQALVALQQVAGMMNASLSYIDGLITLIQDRPKASQYFINKARVIGDDSQRPQYFSYSGNEDTERYTTVHVTWTNADDLRYLPKISSVQDATQLAIYGYQPYDLTAFGATTEGQALRAGRYWMYQACYNTDAVSFKMGREGFNCQVDDVFDIYDDDRMGRYSSGRIVSATSNTVTLDRTVTIDPGVTTIFALFDQNGTYATYTVANTAGTYSTLTITGAFTTIPTKYSPFGIASTNVEPTTWKITDIMFDSDEKVFTIQARSYNEANYTYVDSGYTIPTAVYTLPQLVAPLAPTNLVTVPTQFIDPVDGLLRRGVIIEWDRPTQQNVSYVAKWRKDNGNYTSSPAFITNSFELDDIVPGVYDFLISSIGVTGQYSAPASITYTLDTSGGGASTTLTDITNLEVTGIGGTTWTGVDLAISFTNPVANQGILKDFVVTIKTTGGTLLRQVVLPPVNGGDEQSYIYHFADNVADGGGTPNRAVAVTVQGRDQLNNTTTGITATLTNAAPAVPSNITAVATQGTATITWTPETDVDVQGYLVWFSSTNGFTPGSGNVMDCGNTAIASFPNLTKNTTYYYRVAAYDVFGKSLSGSGLNVSSQLSTATPTNVGIPAAASAPGSALEGDFYFNTTDKTLYRYNGTAWTNATDGSTITPGTADIGILVAGELSAAVGSFGTVLSNLIGATSITASVANISVLSDITGSIGTLFAGLITNNSGTNTINLSATGTTPFINTPQFQVLANGNATFGGGLGTITVGELSNNSGTNVINLNATGSGLFINTPAFNITAAGVMTLSQLDVVGTLNVAGNAITTTQSAVSTASVGAVQYLTIGTDDIPPGDTTVPVEIIGTLIGAGRMDIALFPGIYDMGASASITFTVPIYVLTYTYPSPFPTGATIVGYQNVTITTTPWTTAGNVVASTGSSANAYTVAVLQELAAGTYTIACYDYLGTDGWLSGMTYAGLSVKVVKR